MRWWLRTLWIVVSFLLSITACANLGESGGNATGGAGSDGGGGNGGTVKSARLTVGCANSFNNIESLLEWELRVSPSLPILSGDPFAANLSGVALFDEAFLDGAQAVVPRGVREVDLVELNATVYVRSGAVQPDGGVVLVPDPEVADYECFRAPRTPCDPAHDEEGTPGLRGNADCTPISPLNPCGRFVQIPISNDCEPDGLCDSLGKRLGPLSQCALNEFCVTGDLPIELKPEIGQYEALAESEVLFGWADETTGAVLAEGGSNAGSWELPEAVYAEPAGPIGLRVVVGALTVALECTMGVDCRGEHGPNSRCLDSDKVSPTPDSLLISFPVEP